MRARQASLVAYISTAHALIHAIEVTYGVLLLRIKDDFGVGFLLTGIVATGFAFTFGFGALPSGVLVDRLGTQRVLTIAFSMAAGACLLVATSPNPVLLGLFLGLLGLGIGLYHPAGLSFIAQVARQRGLALGWHGVAGNLGIAATPLVAVGVAEAFDWRWAYVLLAVLALAMAISLRMVRLDRPGAPATEPSVDAATAGSLERGRSDDADEPPPGRLRAFLPLFLVYGVFVLNGFVYRGSITFLPTHLENHLHISWFGLDELAWASGFTTVAFLGGTLGQLFGGTLSERYRLERLTVPLTFSMLPFLLLIGLTGGLPLVLFATLFVFANFSGQPIYTGLIADYTPKRALGRSYGISFFAAFGIGSSAGTVGGLFADRWGTYSVFLMLAGFVLIAMTLPLAIWRLSEREARRAPAHKEAPPAGWGGK